MATTKRNQDQATEATIVTVTFERERETKNTVRYAEVTEDGAPTHVGTLYLQKHATHAMGNPENVRVTIAAHVAA